MSGWAWGCCARQLVMLGAGDLCGAGKCNFTGRQKGQPALDKEFPGLIGLNCGIHILRNARANAPKAEKSFHDNMFWKVQGSEPQAKCHKHLDAFDKNYPKVKECLKAIPVASWVKHAQIATGARACGWRTSNTAEIGQPMLKSARAEHPLDFFNEVQ